MKKVKIPGITRAPLFFTRMHGYFDGKRGAVQLDEDKWKGQYLENKNAIYNAFTHQVYTALERDTATLHKESAELSVEHEKVREKLREPEKEATGTTASIRARNAARLSAVKPQLRGRQQEILLRLATIDEDIIKAVNEAANVKREASSLTVRRVQAYLHGAALAQHRTQKHTKYEVTDDFEDELEYKERHKLNDMVRKSILAAALKEVTQDETQA